MAVDRSDTRDRRLYSPTVNPLLVPAALIVSISTYSKMSILSDTARLSSNPEHDMMLQDPHPDLLESSPSSSEAKPARMTGGGMRAAMTAGYDPSTKLATGTTMAEYKRINMRATTIGMWGGIVAGGLVSEYIRSDLAVSLLIVAMALKRRTSLSKNALTFSFLCESTTSSTLSHPEADDSHRFFPFLRHFSVHGSESITRSSSKSQRCQTTSRSRWGRIYAL